MDLTQTLCIAEWAFLECARLQVHNERRGVYELVATAQTITNIDFQMVIDSKAPSMIVAVSRGSMCAS